MKVKVNMIVENRSHRPDINSPRRRNRHKDTKYVKCLSKILPDVLSNT